MSRDKRVPLRAEDSTSWEEFQARYDAEVEAGIRRFRSLAKIPWRIGALVCGLVNIILWKGVIQEASFIRWIELPLAMFALIPLTYCLTKGPRSVGRQRPVTSRQRELDAVREEWKARADRGEMPMATPGGPKVWQDQ